MHLAALFVLVMIGTDFGALSVSPCLDGWHYVNSSETCIRISKGSDKRTWERAREKCQSEGGDLVMIMNATKNEDVHGVIFNASVTGQTEVFWIGLNDRVDEGKNTWNDKCMDANYAPVVGEHLLDQLNCGVLYYDTVYSNSSWMYHGCSVTSRYICEKPASISYRVDKCPHGWYEYSGSKSCIKIVTTPKTWQAARSTCQKDGGDLPVVRQRAKEYYIYDIISWLPVQSLRQGFFWFGLNDLQSEGNYRWLDNCTNVPTSINFQGNGHCLTFSGAEHFWRLKTCTQQHMFVCEKSEFNKEEQGMETLKLKQGKLQKSVKALLGGQYRYGAPTVCERFTGVNVNRPRPNCVMMTISSIDKLIRCDMVTDGGGWIFIQRRIHGDESFNRTWMEYRHGFGSPLLGDFWLGNEAVHQLTRNRNYVLRIEMRYTYDRREVEDHVEYQNFRIGSEAENYRLTVGTDRGTNNDAGAADEHGLSSQNGNNFVTYDRTGGLNGPDCALENFGWWITSCTATNLNDVWHTVENVNNLRWIKDNLWRYPMYTEMKIRAQ